MTRWTCGDDKLLGNMLYWPVSSVCNIYESVCGGKWQSRKWAYLDFLGGFLEKEACKQRLDRMLLAENHNCIDNSTMNSNQDNKCSTSLCQLSTSVSVCACNSSVHQPAGPAGVFGTCWCWSPAVSAAGWPVPASEMSPRRRTAQRPSAGSLVAVCLHAGS